MVISPPHSRPFRTKAERPESATGFATVSAEPSTEAYKSDSAKFAGLPPSPILGASHAADVSSVDIYRFDPRPMVKHIYELARSPVLVAEFAFCAETSGLSNTKGAGPKVPDQAARSRACKNYVTWPESLPEAVGFHWFEWCDEPNHGRFDGENLNYGLVNIKNPPYKRFVTEVKAANSAAISAHRELMK